MRADQSTKESLKIVEYPFQIKYNKTQRKEQCYSGHNILK